MTNSKKHKVCLALGSNVGDRLVALRTAKERLAHYMTITAQSPVYETLAAYVTDQPPFLNAVLIAETALDPMALLFTVKEIEREIGRLPTFRFGPRVIDIDIVLYDALVMHTQELTIPHALMHERGFVLRPLVDVAAEWVHPVFGKTVRDLLSALPQDEMERTIDEML